MRLSAVFVLTLAVSVIVSATATWGLTYSTSYGELRDMASGFVALSTAGTGDFAQLVRRLISNSSSLVSSILDTEYDQSMSQLNETGQEFLGSTLDLMALVKNATVQAQDLVTALAVYFGGFMASVISQFTLVGTDYASQLRMESAARVQTIFGDMIQERITALQRQARLYSLGLMNLSQGADQPPDDATCTLLGMLCVASEEMQKIIYIGNAKGGHVTCDVTSVAAVLSKHPQPSSDTVIFYQWTPYLSGASNANFTAWKQLVLAGSNSSFLNVTCEEGTEMIYPICNGTCGFDPRCREWYTVHRDDQTAKTEMTAVYIDVQTHTPVVTLSYPILSGSPPTLVAVTASDFYFSDVNAYLETLSTSQLVAVIFNSSDLLVVGTSQACANASAQRAGVPIAAVCNPTLQGLGGWLAANRALQHNVSVELAGTLWDVFPGVVDSFSYFVAVGMNKSAVYAVINAIAAEANATLRAVYQQQTARMAAVEAQSLAEMDAVAAEKVASLQALQAQERVHLVQMQNQTTQALNTTRQKSAQDLSTLTANEMAAIQRLEDYHLSRVNDSIGTTFGAVVGIFMGILLLGSYGTWAVTKQIQQITQVIEDVAEMKVETLEVTQKSPIREVQRIEAALGVLVGRLAEYKTYMPAGLFQQGDHPEDVADVELSPNSGGAPAETPGAEPVVAKRCLSQRQGSSPTISPCGSRSSSAVGLGAPSARLLRRSVVAMVVNVAHFQADLAQRSAGQLEATLNRLISAVHSIASKAQGNIDAILGDQVLVTFNAHFHCSDPPTAASNVALELLETLGGDKTFPGRVQIGMAAGPMYVGHLGYASFKAMVAMGAPMKVASLLSHLSGFHEPVALLCPSVCQRVKYHFALQPVDFVELPLLGEHVALYSKSIAIFSLQGRAVIRQETEEWLYQINGDAPSGGWEETFRAATRASTPEEAQELLGAYLAHRPVDPLALRLLCRVGRWQARAGLTLAERPDGAQELLSIGAMSVLSHG